MAALAAPGELAGAAERFLQISEKALEHLGENYPQLTKLAAKLGHGAGAAGAYKLLNKLGPNTRTSGHVAVEDAAAKQNAPNSG